MKRFEKYGYQVLTESKKNVSMFCYYNNASTEITKACTDFGSSTSIEITVRKGCVKDILVSLIFNRTIDDSEIEEFKNRIDTILEDKYSLKTSVFEKGNGLVILAEPK